MLSDRERQFVKYSDSMDDVLPAMGGTAGQGFRAWQLEVLLEEK